MIPRSRRRKPIARFRCPVAYSDEQTASSISGRRVGEEFVVVGHHGPGGLGVDLLAERRRTDQVTEQCRHLLANGVIINCFARRSNGCSRGAALVAELRSGRQLRSALGALHIEPGTALRAELRARCVSGFTLLAIHRHTPYGSASLSHSHRIVRN